MSKGEKPKDVFDIERIREIIELMEQHDLCEVDLQQGDEKIKLNRGSADSIYTTPLAAAPPAQAGSQASSSPATDSASASGTISIDAPMVGTFFARAKPGSEPFVKVGDRVNEDTIVCIVEAMKVFNEIPAECNGKIVEVLVNDQEPVDYGKTMFRVQPNV